MKGLELFSLLLWLPLAALPEAAWCQADPAPERPARAEVSKTEVPGIRNFSRIDGSTGFGGATQPSAMTRLKEDGFSSVVNLRLASEPDAEVAASRAAAEAAGLHYVHLPFDPARPDPELVPDFLAVVDDAANRPVYIHCASATRAAALWMIKRVLEDGWATDEASREARQIAENPDKAVELAERYLASHGP